MSKIVALGTINNLWCFVSESHPLFSFSTSGSSFMSTPVLYSRPIDTRVWHFAYKHQEKAILMVHEAEAIWFAQGFLILYVQIQLLGFPTWRLKKIYLPLSHSSVQKDKTRCPINLVLQYLEDSSSFISPTLFAFTAHSQNLVFFREDLTLLVKRPPSICLQTNPISVLLTFLLFEA